ncbi:MAG: trypsin-like peptidase domain-containing protein [Parcubacteria group bacterium]|nr:trypsin-like peptidase domain-containing protein [Parcubacteria group bacterium]
MDNELKKQVRILINVVLAVSLIVGGLTGGAVGYLVSQGRLWGVTPQTSLTPGDLSRPRVPETDHEAAVIAAIEKVKPAVVSIIITKDLPKVRNLNPFRDFLSDEEFRFFFPSDTPSNGSGGNATERREVGRGSGFFITADGLIVTNRHVVDDGNGNVLGDFTVVTGDGKELPAKVVARDPVLDVAFLDVEGEGYPVAPVGDSDNLRIGETVIAIGNPLGEFENTASAGIISGLARNITATSGLGSSERLEGVIQTDAAINPGNSGGPLVALNGEVVGVNTAIVQGAEGLGFAIPINDIRNQIESVKADGTIERPFLGVRYRMIDEALKEANNLSVDKGALVVRGENAEELAVMPGSPADKAGILENDIILEFDGVALDQDHSLARLVQQQKVGDTVTLKLLSKGETKTVRIILEKRTG